MDKFFAALRKQSTAKRQDVVEKDYYLHLLLSEISSDGYLRDNLIFKGGTCLVKAYLGYYRFSEDLDFTWKDIDASMSGKSRSQCGKEAEKVIQHLKIITDRLGLRFSGKKDGEDVTFGSGGRMVIIKPTYYSELEKARKEVKMGLNFFDETIFPATEKNLETYLDDIESKELKLLFEEPYGRYSQKVRLTCYDCREIFVEKCRALMTRPIYKHRDSLDLYMMKRKYEYDVIDHESYIIDKVSSAINNFTRYRDNLKIEIPALDRDALDDNLLLIDKPNGLEGSINEMHAQVESIRRKIIEDDAGA